MKRQDPFESYDFTSLSITDLLNARDQYHFHLMNKANVVGTAIGLYLIRTAEDWPKNIGEGRTPKKKLTFARKLSNSQVRDYSWPCVLVFVKKWEELDSFRNEPWAAVPKTLYLADGRAVPVCVVEADSAPADSLLEVDAAPLPSSKFGGGLPIFVDVQHERRMATAGCLVSDGHLTYALTARHVSGDKGTIVSSAKREGDVQIGTGSAKQLTRLPFSKVYPDFPGRKSFLNLDIGLVELEDITAWTSNIYGLPPIGRLADFYAEPVAQSD